MAEEHLEDFKHAAGQEEDHMAVHKSQILGFGETRGHSHLVGVLGPRVEGAQEEGLSLDLLLLFSLNLLQQELYCLSDGPPDLPDEPASMETFRL